MYDGDAIMGGGELVLAVDDRLGNAPHYIVVGENEPMFVPDEVRKCVAFLCYKANDGMNKLAGTAFFMTMRYVHEEGGFVYLITAKHVIDGIRKASIDGNVYARVNTTYEGAGKGKYVLIPLPIERWLSHPNNPNIDVSVFPWAPPIDVIDYKALPIEMVATKEVIAKEGIGVGDEVFLTGLFANHYGKERNLPIVRIGNIALMPTEPIYSSDLGEVDAYLIEARSIGGLSGSPVFVHIGGIRRVGNQNKIIGDRFFWLGLMHGHWDVSEKDIDVIKDKENQSVNMGIAIVIPVDIILEVVNQEAFMKQREQHEKAIRDKKSPKLDTNKDETYITKDTFHQILDKASQPIEKPESDSEQP